MPKISVIMPAYNAEKYIAEAIDSILGQTFRDFEFIILNDCSQDRTEEIILSYKDPRIVYVKNEENLGVARTLNKGLQIACGEYIARMDADDVSLPERFDKQLAYIAKHPKVAVLGTGLDIFNAKGLISSNWSATDPDQMKIDLFFACGLAHPSVMMRRDEIIQLGGYDPDFNGLEDYELWCRVCEKYEITALPDKLFRYRIHGEQVTKNQPPQYLIRMRRLKERQLEQLGVSTQIRDAEAYYRFCEGKKPETATEIKELDRFFELVLHANEKSRFYNQQKLNAVFQSILVPAVSRLPIKQQKEVAAASKLFCSSDIWQYLTKRKIKKLLGRQ